MSTLAQQDPAISSMPQEERLARKEALRLQVSALERQIRELQRETALLLASCEHTDASGRSALIGSRTKVCAHCGRVVACHGEKLWG